MESFVLEGLYNSNNIKNLSFGVLQDKLGDVYEKFVINVLENKSYLSSFNNFLLYE